ncbi:hypothetical protein DFJ58DRAFT_220664, partial [Suillus subalutaceus]|uniref:uncharacterized protein n=1 Tax=Suillus subalutaceus TaxID=48586 RepID=UPI001B875443
GWSSLNSCARPKKTKSRRPAQSFRKISKPATNRTSRELQFTMVFLRALFVIAFVVLASLLVMLTSTSSCSQSTKSECLWIGSSTLMLQATQSVNGPSNRSVTHSARRCHQGPGYNAERIALIQEHLDGHPQLKDNMKFAGLYGRAPRGQKRTHTHTSTTDENVAPASATVEQPEHPAVRRRLNEHHPFTPSSQHNLHIPGTHYHTLHPYSYADHQPAPPQQLHLPYNSR